MFYSSYGVGSLYGLIKTMFYGIVIVLLHYWQWTVASHVVMCPRLSWVELRVSGKMKTSAQLVCGNKSIVIIYSGLICKESTVVICYNWGLVYFMRHSGATHVVGFSHCFIHDHYCHSYWKCNHNIQVIRISPCCIVWYFVTDMYTDLSSCVFPTPAQPL